MQKSNTQIAAIQDTNLNEKSLLHNQANRCKEGGKGGGVAFIIKDTIKSSEKHQEVYAIELNAGGNNIKLVNTYITYHLRLAVIQDARHQSVN